VRISPDSEHLRAFLLDRLPAAETAALEENLIVDDDFYQIVRCAEDELIDDYVEGELAASDAEILERRIGRLPELRERVSVRRSLLAAARRQSATGAAASPRRTSGEARRRLYFPAIGVAAAVLIAVGLLTIQHRHPGLDHAAKGVPAVPAPESQGPAAATPAKVRPFVPTVLFFAQHASRGASSAGALRLDTAAAPSATLQLELRESAPAGESWTVTITEAGRTVFRRGGLHARSVGGIRYIETEIEPGSLKPGNCRVTLSGQDSRTAASRWELKVTAQSR
jgi:hypothetical protein